MAEVQRKRENQKENSHSNIESPSRAGEAEKVFFFFVTLYFYSQLWRSLMETQ